LTEVERLAGEIAAVESALKGGGGKGGSGM
jgi:hypothetical protein